MLLAEQGHKEREEDRVPLVLRELLELEVHLVEMVVLVRMVKLVPLVIL